MPELEPTLIWGLFLRGLGVVYLVAFASIRRDILGLAGSRGITPLHAQLRAMRRDVPRWRRLSRWPSVFWVGDSDRWLTGVATLGMAMALLVVLGVASVPALVLCWLFYLSYSLALDFFYPWDCALLEAGALSVFMPALEPWTLSAVEAPFELVAWGYRWLLFRIVFGFGKYKFFGPGTLHGDYLKSFLVSQPLSTPLGLWFARRAPRWVFVAALVGLFLIEVPIPFLVFVPGPPRLIAMAAITALMVGIQLTGNFGFFNLIVLVLAVPLLDGGSVFDVRLEDIDSVFHGAAAAYVAWLFVAGLLSLPLNSWVAQAWVYWPAFDRIRGLRWIVRLLRAAMPLRLVHAYGVFSPESGPPLKWVPVVEGSLDGETFEPYGYRFMPSTESSPARFVAPFMPRLDHALIYDALGISLTNLMGSVFSTQNPYRYSRSGWMQRLAQRLLEGSPDVLELIGHDPFEGTRPKIVRVRLKAFEQGAEARWTVTDAGPHLDAQRDDPSMFEDAFPLPELFHWDEWVTRGQCPDLRRRLEAPEDTTDWRELFDVIVPQVRLLDLRRTDALDAGAARISDAVGGRARHRRLEALSARIAWRVATAFESVEPGLSWFDLGLQAHRALLRGEAFVALCHEDPRSALDTLGPVNLQDGLRLFAAFRPEVFRFQVRKARLRELTLRGAARHPPPVAPGFVRHLSELATLLPEPDRIPRYARTAAGWQREDVTAATRSSHAAPG